MKRLQSHRRQNRLQRRNRQEQSLRENERELRALAASQNEQEFFDRITPVLGPLKDYIKRQLRLAYADGGLTPLYTSDDILDEVVLRAYQRFSQKPADLTVEQWLYRLANEVLESYIRQRKSQDTRRRSLEGLREKELRSLEEVKNITADSEGEVWLAEDLDDAEYNPPEITPPEETLTPEEELERKEEISRIIRALAGVPARDRIVFDLFAVERFPKEAVARIVGVPPEEVPRITDRVRRQVLQQISVQEKAS